MQTSHPVTVLPGQRHVVAEGAQAGVRLRSRRGYSLVQLIVVMGIAAVLMSLCAIVLHRMFRQEVALVRAISDTASWHRLARDFRDDAHRAATVSTNETGTEIRFVFGSDGALWSASGNELRRTRLPSGAPADAVSLPAESYRFDEVSLNFVVKPADESRALPLVSVSVGEVVNGVTRVPVELLAAVGLNRTIGKNAASAGSESVQ